MEKTSLTMTAAEVALAADLRIVVTPEHKFMAQEIRDMMKSGVWEEIHDKFYDNREKYAVVYNYMQMHLL